MNIFGAKAITDVMLIARKLATAMDATSITVGLKALRVVDDEFWKPKILVLKIDFSKLHKMFNFKNENARKGT